VISHQVSLEMDEQHASTSKHHLVSIALAALDARLALARRCRGGRPRAASGESPARPTHGHHRPDEL
jgi:hypothetical protein